MSASELGQRIAAAQARTAGNDGGSMMSGGAPRGASRSGGDVPAIASIVTFTAWACIASGVGLFIALMERRGYGLGWSVSFESFAFLMGGVFSGVMLLGFSKVIALLNVIVNNTRPSSEAE